MAFKDSDNSRNDSQLIEEMNVDAEPQFGDNS